MVRRPGRFLMSVLKYGLLVLGAAVMLLPFVEMFVGALRTPAERFARPPVFWPSEPQWGVYARVFQDLPMARWYLNSLFVTVSVTAVQLLTSAAAGFALAKYQFRGRELLFRSILSAQMFPFFLFLIPTFFLIRYWPLAGGNDLLGGGGNGLLGTYAALIVPFAITWYGIFLMRQFMVSIPDELLDAARIDGCSEWRIFSHIVLPLVKPALATLGIFSFIYQWNEFIWTVTITRTAPALQTLPVGIFLMSGAYNTVSQESFRQAALAVSIVPLAVLFLLLQRYYVKGVVMSGLKG